MVDIRLSTLINHGEFIFVQNVGYLLCQCLNLPEDNSDPEELLTEHKISPEKALEPFLRICMDDIGESLGHPFGEVQKGFLGELHPLFLCLSV